MGIPVPDLQSIPDLYGLTNIQNQSFLIKGSTQSVILHPKSKGSAREWPLQFYKDLIDLLIQNDFQPVITGTKQEGEQVFTTIDRNKVLDLTGKLTLDELLGVIKNCGVLVAASTGVLHIAAAVGTNTIGLFAPKVPIHPGRWAPIGKHACYIVHPIRCQKCQQHS